MTQDHEERAALRAVAAAGLSDDRLRLVSRASRLVWHAPHSAACVIVTKPGTKTLEQVAHEARAFHVLRDAGVRTPRLLHGPIRLPGERFALVTEWVDHTAHLPGERAWRLMAEQAAKVATARTEGLVPVRMPEVPESTWRNLLGEEDSPRFSARWDQAKRALAWLLASGDPVVSHDDLHPGNALIDRVGQCWLVDLEHVGLAPPEWDLAALTILHQRFNDPQDLDTLLGFWPFPDRDRLAICVMAREALIVGRLFLLQGTPDAIAEGKRRMRGLFGPGPRWAHLTPMDDDQRTR